MISRWSSGALEESRSVSSVHLLQPGGRRAKLRLTFYFRSVSSVHLLQPRGRRAREREQRVVAVMTGWPTRG